MRPETHWAALHAIPKADMAWGSILIAWFEQQALKVCIALLELCIDGLRRLVAAPFFQAHAVKYRVQHLAAFKRLAKVPWHEVLTDTGRMQYADDRLFRQEECAARLISQARWMNMPNGVAEERDLALFIALGGGVNVPRFDFADVLLHAPLFLFFGIVRRLVFVAQVEQERLIVSLFVVFHDESVSMRLNKGVLVQYTLSHAEEHWV
mmetsp:Transcript_14812/g.47182  ORF Transcript_14812/g.47182 Transcript_14812/m.47182 type:complete len:208 (-) Transcript_14812:22-645(-)